MISEICATILVVAIILEDDISFFIAMLKTSDLIKYMYTIDFTNPCDQIVGQERRSKLLNPESNLYKWLSAAKGRLQTAYPGAIHDRMDFHVEVVKKGEQWSRDLLNERSMELNGTDIRPSECLESYGKAIALKIPSSDMHITVAYFPSGVPKNAMSLISDAGAQK